MTTPANKRLGWGTASKIAERRAAAEPQTQEDLQKQQTRDREAIRRAQAIKAIVQSPDFWAVKDLFTETFDDVIDALSGSSDMPPDDVLRLVGGLKCTRALYESFDMTLGQGHRALARVSGHRLLNIAAAEAEKPATVARQPLT